MASAKVFVREVTGFIREAGLLDVFALNYGYTGSTFSLWLAFIMGQTLWAFPGSDFGIASLITIIPTVLFISFVWAFMSICMPRSGGDYVYISRVIHPAIAFATNFTHAIMLCFFVAFGAYWGAGLGVATLLANIGYHFKIPLLIQWSIALQDINNLFILSTILIIIFGLIVLSGLKRYLYFNNALLIIGTIGSIVGIILLATTPQVTFQERFNSFMKVFTEDPNYYMTVIKQAESVGYTPAPPFSWTATFLAVPIAFSTSIYCVGSSYIGGEVKEVSKNQLISMPLAAIWLGVWNAIIYWVSNNAVGYAFNSSINYLWWQGEPLKLPLWPFFNLWATLSTDNVLLAALAGIGFLALGLMYPPMNILLVTRMIFSWSFDRIFPEKLASVDERTRSPIWAVLFTMVIAEIFLIIFTYTPYFTGLAGIAGTLVMYIFTSLAAVLLPFRLKSIYEVSPISKYKLGKVPLISILGVGGVILSASVLIAYLIEPRYLVNAPSSLSIITGTLVLGFIIFYVAKAYRKAKGIDISLAFKELPPE